VQFASALLIFWNLFLGRAARSIFTTGAVLRFDFLIVDGVVKLERNKALLGIFRLKAPR
jgi:hypothetical protein